MRKSVLNTALAAVFGMSTITALDSHAATLNTGDTLTINAGVPQLNSNGNQTNVSGSWFGIDFTGDGAISGIEKTALSQGTTGLMIGVLTSPGASHLACPVAGDSNTITAPWCFLGETGSDYLTTVATGGTTGINLSGWTWTWNGIPAVSWSSGAWGAGFSNGIANFTWDGVYGDAYTLDYHATAAHNDPSGFGDVRYALHLEGIVKPVPVPAAVWLLGSGLLSLVRVTRRRSNVA